MAVNPEIKNFTGDIYLDKLDNLTRTGTFHVIIVLALQSIVYAEAGSDHSPCSYEFENHCASCHGEDGKGNGPMAGQLTKPPTDLTLLSKENGGSFPETVVYQIIDGRRVNIFHGTREMPIWGDRFYAADGNEDTVNARISEIIKFIESIQIE